MWQFRQNFTMTATVRVLNWSQGSQKRIISTKCSTSWYPQSPQTPQRCSHVHVSQASLELLPRSLVTTFQLDRTAQTAILMVACTTCLLSARPKFSNKLLWAVVVVRTGDVAFIPWTCGKYSGLLLFFGRKSASQFAPVPCLVTAPATLLKCYART